MSLCRSSLLAFACCGFAFGQQGNSPRLGALYSCIAVYRSKTDLLKTSGIQA
jgi:hypothetical protein